MSLVAGAPGLRGQSLRMPVLLGGIILALALTLSLLALYASLPLDAELATESTPGRLALWLARQSGNAPDELESPWARLAQARAVQLGQDELQPAQILSAVSTLRAIYLAGIAILLGLACATVLKQWASQRDAPTGVAKGVAAHGQPPPMSMGGPRGVGVARVAVGDPQGRPYNAPAGGAREVAEPTGVARASQRDAPTGGARGVEPPPMSMGGPRGVEPARRGRGYLLLALILLDALLFIIPAVDSSHALARVVYAILLTALALILCPGRISRAAGFCLALSLLMVGWEAGKSFADAVSYKILLPQASWQYRQLPSLDAALLALQTGRVDVVIADRKDLDDLMPPQPASDRAADDLPYPDLRYFKQLDRSQGLAFLPVTPAFPGRLSLAMRADDAAETTGVRQIHDREIAAVSGDFAETRFLSQPRSLVLLDLKILNDLNLPHLQMIAEAFLQPARRNGELLLLRILTDAGIYTFSEAIFGFLFGAALGLLLGALFAHSPLLERGLLPYVVASQTVPILAIAPMVVIWLGAGQLSVAVIAAYLTFFPVTINTLRGMQSPAAEQVELLRSYAANRWTILWKLRLPAALPYIFTALKVSATASVVGAIIGELPSGIGDGLGRAILDFSSDYSLVSTPKLWASIVMAAAVGMLFFAAVTACERLALRRVIRSDGEI